MPEQSSQSPPPKSTLEKPAAQPLPKKTSATIKDKNLIESILYLKQNNLLPESKSKVKFETTLPYIAMIWITIR